MHRVRRIDDRLAGTQLEPQIGVAVLHVKRTAFVALGIVEEDRAAKIAAQRALGRLKEGGVGVEAILHTGPVARQERRSDEHRKSEIAKLVTSRERLQEQLRTLLKRLRFVQLLVLFGGVVGVGDPSVGERRRRRDPFAFVDFGVGQQLQDSVHQASRERSRARASNTDFFELAPSMASAASMSRPASRISWAISSLRSAGLYSCSSAFE